MKTKDEYIESLATELKEWSAQIDHLTSKTEGAAAHLKLKYFEELDALRTRQHAAAEKLEELREAGGDTWESFVEATDQAWYDFRTGLTNAASRFK